MYLKLPNLLLNKDTKLTIIMYKNFFRIDWHLFLPMLVLLFVGLTTLHSLQGSYFKSQFIFAVIGILCFFLFSTLDIYYFKNIALYVYIISLIFLFIVLILGVESRGAVRWFEFIGLRLQFSEIIKPFLCISFAFFISHNKPSFRMFILSIILLFPVIFLLYRQPDLGNALLYAAVALLTLLICGYPLKTFLIIFAGIGTLIPISFKFLHQYQRQRLFTFFHVNSDPLGISYNIIQSVIAVGSGMFYGKGLGQGTQSNLWFLPERHTDFIFASLSEELGFIGACIIIFSFCFLLYRIYKISVATLDTFSRAFVICTFWFFIIQFVVNVGMNIGILPIVGITLPFVSYGGSSLIASAIFLGLLSSLNKRKDAQVLEI